MDEYKLVKFKKGKKEQFILCTGPGGSSGLAAIINLFSFEFSALIANIYDMDEQGTKNVLTFLLKDLFKTREIEDDKKSVVLGVIANHQTNLRVSPTLLSPLNFSSTDARHLFVYLGVKLLHGWVLDPSVNIYQTIKSFPRANLLQFLASIQDQEDQT